MNYHLVLYTLGNYLLFFTLCFFPSLFCATYYREWKMLQIFGIVAVLSIGSGLILKYVTQHRGARNQFTKREGVLTVSLIWIISGLIGACPFYLSNHIPRFVSALFESVSGFTTTGASVVTNIEALPHSLLFWRSFSHWLGGLGIVVLFLILLPYLGVGGRILFRSEVPGPEADVLKPKVRETAFALFKIYLWLTIAETILLFVCGMSVFDALCHTFGTLATGGYSTKNASIAHFQSLSIELVIMLFMLLAGINFSLYYHFLNGERRSLLRNSEFKAYIAIIVLASIAITANLYAHDVGNLGSKVRDAVFQVLSIQTTTGYGTADFDKWPGFSQLILFGLMFIGGCAGSTGGGIKVIRWVIIFKYIYNQIENVFRPNAILPVRIGDKVLEDNVVKAAVGLFCLWLIIFGIVSLIIAGMGFDFVTSTSATAAILNNIGPGLSDVGPTMNYSVIPETGKFLFVICMLFGRLEIYTLIILFHPAFWKK